MFLASPSRAFAGAWLALALLLPAYSRADAGTAPAQLGTTLAVGTPAEAKVAVTSAMALLAGAERNVADARERALVAAAYVRVVRKAFRAGLTLEMGEAFMRAERLLAPKPMDETADLPLISLAERIGQAMPPADAERWLLRIEPLLYSPAHRAALAGAWWLLVDRLDASPLRQGCVKQGVRLAPGSMRANAEVAAIAGRQATGVRHFVMWVALLGAIVALPFWQRRDKAAHASAVGNLGPVLLGNPPAVSDKLIFGSISLLFLWIGALVISQFFEQPAVHAPEGVPASILLRSALVFVLGFAIVALLLLAFSHRLSKSLGIYELGVTQHSIFGTRTVRYSEISRFRYGVIARYRLLLYMGSQHWVIMASESGKTISFAKNDWRRSNKAFDALRDRASQAVSQRMIAQLRSGQEVLWGRKIFIGNEGIRVGNRTVQYGPGLHGQIEKGTFRLYGAGEKSALARIDCDDDNFYPGLILLRPMLDGSP